MKLLVNTKTLSGHEYQNTEEDIKNLQAIVQDELQMWEPSPGPWRFSFGPTILGAWEPERVTLIARDWNNAIRQTLVTSTSAVKVSGGEAFILDSDFTHALYLAARAADNKFSLFGNCGILTSNVCGLTIYCTVLTDELLNQVEDNPGHWVVMTVQIGPMV